MPNFTSGRLIVTCGSVEATTNPVICKLMNQLGITKADEIIADNQMKCIYEIRQEGFNIKPTFKGADSILTGIDILKRHPIRITKRSVNLIREFKNYKWKEDAAGKPLNVPIDRFNHAIDAIRYACLSRLFMGNRIVKTMRKAF
ncbi:MAG: terminase large subunit [Bacteroidetes bacterium]|nr:terminase large subunit [Bacteroidota bacterium]